jgi:hypothetical protein
LFKYSNIGLAIVSTLSPQDAKIFQGSLTGSGCLIAALNTMGTSKTNKKARSPLSGQLGLLIQDRQHFPGLPQDGCCVVSVFTGYKMN